MSDKKFGHVMIDIETMSRKSNSAIVSLAAVFFDKISGETGAEFYRNISLQSCLDAGLLVEGDTVMWWLKQSQEAREALTTGDVVSLEFALVEFAEFLKDRKGFECEIWGNSPRFDLGKLEDAYTKFKWDIPWDFRNERCVRTIVAEAPEIKKFTKFRGDAHSALADCHHQIKYLSATYRHIYKID